MLTLTGVTKAFGARRVLDAPRSRDRRRARASRMLGANGSGKTTTLRCIVGLARPDRGPIAIGGVDLARDPIRRASPPQLPAAEIGLSADADRSRDARGRGPAARSSAPAPSIASSNRAASRALADRGVGHLSGGERQRLAMAVAFLPSVDLYLFDEPSANLDPVASRILFQRARQLKRDGHTLLFTTHIPADVRHLATRIVLLRNGRIESESGRRVRAAPLRADAGARHVGDEHEDAIR